MRYALRMPDPLSLTDLRTLLNTPTLPDLGPGPRSGRAPIASLTTKLDSLLAALKHGEVSQLVRGTVLLWHDHLGAAHRIAQAIGSPDGSFLHAMMHRREPDYWNSKYWWRRAGQHPCFPDLARRARELLEVHGGRVLSQGCLAQGRWDPMEFVEACEAAASAPENRLQIEMLQAVQAVEFEVFLEHLVEDS